MELKTIFFLSLLGIFLLTNILNSDVQQPNKYEWKRMSREDKLIFLREKVKENENKKRFSWTREKIIETLFRCISTKDAEDNDISKEEIKIKFDSVDAKNALLFGDYFTEDEKYNIIIKYLYEECLVKPNVESNMDYMARDFVLLFEDWEKRINNELNSQYGKNDCFRKKMILILAANKVGGREIGDKLIEIFDKDRYNSFRYRALEIFVANYSDYYTKEELMPYILKLMKDPYFSICKVCDVVPKKECLGKMKSYPFRDALVPLLRKYNIKFEYIQLDECMLRGVPVLTE
jgi:hypothetical protein